MNDSYLITLKTAETSFQLNCRREQNLVEAIAAAMPRHPSVGCRNGGCGVCKVKIERGSYSTGRMSAAEVDEEARGQGIALACRVYPESDLDATYIGKDCSGG